MKKPIRRTVPPEAMRRLLALEQAAVEAARRRDEAVALVLVALGASENARIVLCEDGSGEVIEAGDISEEGDGIKKDESAVET